MVDLPVDDDALLAQCDVQTFRGRGPGGQSVNTTDSAVRLRHRPTGVVVTCREHRSQYQNKKACLSRLRARVAELGYEAPERKPTRPSRAAREERLRQKTMRAKRKRERRAPVDEDE